MDRRTSFRSDAKKCPAGGGSHVDELEARTMIVDDATGGLLNRGRKVVPALTTRWGLRRLAAVTAVGLVAFGLGAIWYIVFGDIVTQFTKGGGTPQPWKLAVAPAREILSAAVLAYLVDHVRPRDWKGALWLGFVLWVGFYLVQLAGAVIFESLPLPLAAVHAGDWLMKLLVMICALSAWQRRAMQGIFQEEPRQ
jgi:hypothetical protein